MTNLVNVDSGSIQKLQGQILSKKRLMDTPIIHGGENLFFFCLGDRSLQNATHVEIFLTDRMAPLNLEEVRNNFHQGNFNFKNLQAAYSKRMGSTPLDKISTHYVITQRH